MARDIAGPGCRETHGGQLMWTSVPARVSTADDVIDVGPEDSIEIWFASRRSAPAARTVTSPEAD